MTEFSDDELLAELGVTREPAKTSGRTPRQERIIAGFEDIQRFVETNHRTPRHGEDLDIFERLYAIRLDQLRAIPEARELLAGLDTQGLLTNPPETATAIDDEALLAELGAAEAHGVNVLKHVSSREERRAAEEVANRTTCPDFDRFQPLFQQAESDLELGLRQARPFGKDASVLQGDFFILGGQIVYVAEVGDTIKAPNGETDARLRLIYSNGTESNLLRRSLQRALYKDEAGRRLETTTPTLFTDEWDEDDVATGTIYVLRSLSNHPYVAAHRELIHKIGVTRGKVETRIANAVNDATYLLAEVEVVASYVLSQVNRTRLENLFHRIFSPAQLDLTIEDRFGHTVRPREWFLVPLHVIDEAVGRILNGTIAEVVYDPKTARLAAK